jgi:hypothetical protein
MIRLMSSDELMISHRRQTTFPIKVTTLCNEFMTQPRYSILTLTSGLIRRVYLKQTEKQYEKHLFKSSVILRTSKDVFKQKDKRKNVAKKSILNFNKCFTSQAPCNSQPRGYSVNGFVLCNAFMTQARYSTLSLTRSDQTGVP